jgi:hypothetical protein
MVDAVGVGMSNEEMMRRWESGEGYVECCMNFESTFISERY